VSNPTGHGKARTGGTAALFWVAWLLLLGWAAANPGWADRRARRFRLPRLGAIPPAPLPRPQVSPRSYERTTITAWSGVFIGVLCPLIVWLRPLPALALLATLIFALAGLGSGISCRCDAGEGFAQAALTAMISLSLFALAATTMIWLSAWHPVVLLALAIPSVLSCLHLLVQRGALSLPRRSAGA
jgi:hypothetical protein